MEIKSTQSVAETDWPGFPKWIAHEVEKIQSGWTERERRRRAGWAHRSATIQVATDLELDIEQLADGGRAL